MQNVYKKRVWFVRVIGYVSSLSGLESAGFTPLCLGRRLPPPSAYQIFLGRPCSEIILPTPVLASGLGTSPEIGEALVEVQAQYTGNNQSFSEGVPWKCCA
jgi:hypothetical protein